MAKGKATRRSPASAAYKLKGMSEVNRKRRLTSHLKRQPNDKVAAAALKKGEK